MIYQHGYYLYNAHGDVVRLTNGSGAVTKTYNYDAFGNERNADPSDANPILCMDSSGRFAVLVAVGAVAAGALIGGAIIWPAN